ncbi:MAG: extracellular solute-binding protein [Chloroflexi bacterium]|nr:extracellular solute-binding protein [Chloroflexota bacterium]
MRRGMIIVAIVSLFVVLAACSPTTAPAPAPAAPTAAPAAPRPAATAAPEDAAWQKVIEAAKKEGSVTLYSFNFVGDVGLAVSKAFKEKYGITTDIITGRGAEQLERLKAERRTGKMTGDFMEGSRVHNANVKKEGLTISLADLPVFKDKQAWVVDPFVLDNTANVIAFNVFVYAPFVNANLVKQAEAPKSYKDLLDPRWKGKMMLPDPNVSAAAYETFVSFLSLNILDTEYLKALGKQDLRFTLGDDDSIQRLSRGEYSLSIRTAPPVVANYILQGAPLRAVPMAEGHIGSALAALVVKDGPHPNAAKLFANWLMSQEGQTVFGKAKGANTIRKDVQDFLPEPARVPGVKVIMPTEKDTDDMAQMFRDKVLVNLWKK